LSHEGWLIIGIAIAHGFVAVIAHLTLWNFRGSWAIRHIVWSNIGLFFSWVGFSLVVQTLVPETRSFRNTMIDLSLITKLLFTSEMAFGFFLLYKDYMKYGTRNAPTRIRT
jgi:hypothetical protein